MLRDPADLIAPPTPTSLGAVALKGQPKNIWESIAFISDSATSWENKAWKLRFNGWNMNPTPNLWCAGSLPENNTYSLEKGWLVTDWYYDTANRTFLIDF